MEDERTQQHTESITMNSLEIDSIGEMLNIRMGSDCHCHFHHAGSAGGNLHPNCGHA